MPDQPNDGLTPATPDPKQELRDVTRKLLEEYRKYHGSLKFPPGPPKWQLRDQFPPQPRETDVPLRDDPK